MADTSEFDPRLGIRGPLEAWLKFNAYGVFEHDQDLSLVAPFPPPKLMMDTSGVDRRQEFAMHGLLIAQSFAQASPVPLNEFEVILDFGVGVGRLARVFKGFTGTYIGVDVDRRNIDWVSENLPYVAAVRTIPRRALPFGEALFDAIISVSVFTHMNAVDCKFYLDELRRVLKPGGYLMASLHGERVLQRASEEAWIRKMLALKVDSISAAYREITSGNGYYFVPQHTHLTATDYEYGATFVSRKYVETTWGAGFSNIQTYPGIIADFQDIAVFRKD